MRLGARNGLSMVGTRSPVLMAASRASASVGMANVPSAPYALKAAPVGRRFFRTVGAGSGGIGTGASADAPAGPVAVGSAGGAIPGMADPLRATDCRLRTPSPPALPAPPIPAAPPRPAAPRSPMMLPRASLAPRLGLGGGGSSAGSPAVPSGPPSRSSASGFTVSVRSSTSSPLGSAWSPPPVSSSAYMLSSLESCPSTSPKPSSGKCVSIAPASCSTSSSSSSSSSSSRTSTDWPPMRSAIPRRTMRSPAQKAPLCSGVKALNS
mmetsp:Transcript_8294/g.27580  ORF Transcript_8294/g.27580 Transcript_8294/m.27580 type:complete len:266 (+) Transcript_8294:282-1079(+)